MKNETTLQSNEVLTGERSQPRWNHRLKIGTLFGNHGLLILTILLIILFSIIQPDTFPTRLTIVAILSTAAITALASLAQMVVASVGQYDLSVGYTIGITSIMAVALQTRMNLPWELTVLLVLLIGVIVGVVNGLLVYGAKIDSFIATLGTGTIIYGISNWYTNGQQIVGVLPKEFLNIGEAYVLGIPISAFYVLIIALILWIVFEFLPIGRYMYALGSNPRAAELNGIPRGRYIIGAFIVGGFLIAIAGIVLASQLQVGQSNVGPDYLLPSFVGALLGATTVRPGRVNVWGTIIAVLLLAIGVSGIEQLGAAFFVNPLFNGGTLIVAVGLAGYAVRRRQRVHKQAGA
jgi:ribose transport system permease protein